MKTREKIEDLLKVIEDTCKDIRETHGDDSVCGLCEYDDCAYIGAEGDYIGECPGFESDECFVLKQSFKDKYLENTNWGTEEEIAYDTGYSEGYKEGRSSYTNIETVQKAFHFGTDCLEPFSDEKTPPHVPCPCCGKPMRHRYMEDRLYMFRCVNCHVVTMTTANSPDKAAEKLLRAVSEIARLY